MTISKLIPKSLLPYWKLGRYDKPIGTILLYIPTAWAIAFSVPTLTSGFSMMGIAAATALMLRAGGCAINDWHDRHIDTKVERTKSRPLAANEIGHLGTFAFFTFNMSPIFYLFYSMDTLGKVFIASALPILSLYPLAKRFTGYPQYALGVTMSWGIFPCYIFITGVLDLQITFPLFFGSWCWAVIYDTIYAYQDRLDDIKIGIGSSAVSLGEKYRRFFSVLTVGSALGWAGAGYMAGLGGVFYPVASFGVWHLSQQWRTLDINDPKACWERFNSNKTIGAILFCAIVLGRISGSN